MKESRLTPKLTKKKLQDRRFRRTEEKIIKAYFLMGDRNIVKMIKQAGVSRATFYRHHQAAGQILQDYEKYASWLYDDKLSQGPTTMFEMLRFTAENRKILMVLWHGKSREVFAEIVNKVYQLLAPKPMAHHRIYVACVVEILWKWGEDEFSGEKLEAVMADILHLARISEKHLTELKSMGDDEPTPKSPN